MRCSGRARRDRVWRVRHGRLPVTGLERVHRGEEGNVAKEDRGFASMDPAKQREIASKGGKAAHQKGTAHEWTSEEARDAGRKGGIASHRRRREQQGGGQEDSEGSDEMVTGHGGMEPSNTQNREE